MASLDVHVVTPERELWAAPARMVIARGVAGEVGILPGHAPLLIRLRISVLRVQDEAGDWQQLVVDGGFLHVTSGEEETRVDVLASFAQRADEIDAHAARLRAEELEQRVREHRDAATVVELEKALVRAGLHG